MGLPLGFLLPEEDATPQKVQSWRWKVAGSIMALWVIAGFQLAAMFTGVVKVGQLAWADQIVDKADKKEITEVKQELLTQRAVLNDVQQSIEDQRKEQKAAEIRKLALKRCQAPANSDERESYTREIDRLQTEYKKINGGEPYDRPRCSEL